MRALSAPLALLCLAPTAQAQDATHDQLAARFIAALPPSDANAPETAALVNQRGADVARKYPAKTAQIQATFADRQKCADTRRSQAVAGLMLSTAQALSDDELRSLTAFYSGPDYARLETLTEGSAEWNALLARYPLKHFADVMQAQAGEHMIEAVIAAEQACDAALKDALAKEGITE